MLDTLNPLFALVFSALLLLSLTDTTAAPAIQAQQAELERSRLQNALEHKIQDRPQPDQLVKQGILPGKLNFGCCEIKCEEIEPLT